MSTQIREIAVFIGTSIEIHVGGSSHAWLFAEIAVVGQSLVVNVQVTSTIALLFSTYTSVLIDCWQKCW